MITSYSGSRSPDPGDQMVSVSFACKELNDVFPKVQNVKSLNEKAHCNLFFFLLS